MTRILKSSRPLRPRPTHSYALRPQNPENPFSKDRPSANVEQCKLVKLPREIRELIYKFALPEEWEGKPPVIIEALRQFRLLYDEAMIIWHKMDYAWILRKENNYSFLDLSPKMISNIRNIKIVVT